ncbi:MAG TPA: DUF4129 domain-containing protein [Bryobacteraceae bacterium]|nr:DUF4129 domain-containing protein [Bryobacteraceae bacterium]
MTDTRNLTPQAIDMVESAIFLLRSQPARVWAVQAAGAVPLVLSVLYFAFDAASQDIDNRRLAAEALVCAGCFLWFNFCRARFAQLLTGALSSQTPESWRNALDAHELALQSTKLLAMPLAFAALIPLGWTVSFFRSATVFAGRGALRKAGKLAGTWQRQTWACLAILALFSLVIFVNILASLAALPLLVKIFSGAENAFTRLGFSLNWTVFTIALGLTWFTVDPLVQAVFCVRAFLADSRQTGLDLMHALRHLALWAVLAVAIAPHAAAQPAPRVSPQELDSSIEKVLQQREYAWHMPHSQDSRPGLMDRIFAPVRTAFHKLVRWIAELLDRLFRRSQADSTAKPAPFPAVKWTLVALVVLLAAVVSFGLVRLVRTRATKQSAISAQTPRSIQLEDERVSAADLPEDQWIELGRNCLARGDHRLALRAFYLANLSWLGRRGLLTIAPFKSNRDYWRELRRHTTAEELQDAFSENMRMFERGWYGMHAVDAEQIGEFERTFSRMKNHVEA